MMWDNTYMRAHPRVYLAALALCLSHNVHRAIITHNGRNERIDESKQSNEFVWHTNDRWLSSRPVLALQTPRECVFGWSSPFAKDCCQHGVADRNGETVWISFYLVSNGRSPFAIIALTNNAIIWFGIGFGSRRSRGQKLVLLNFKREHAARYRVGTITENVTSLFYLCFI